MITIQSMHETRRVLWRQKSEEIVQAQQLEAEAVRLENLRADAANQARMCRERAEQFGIAAEALTRLDKANGVD